MTVRELANSLLSCENQDAEVIIPIDIVDTVRYQVLSVREDRNEVVIEVE